MKIVDTFDYKTEYETKCNWPEDTFVQGGSNGLVIAKGNNYTTAYFEAFPKKPDMFVRGEGYTLEEAEKNAFAKFTKWISCEEHDFEKIKKNGLGKCKKCGFITKAFEAEYTCIKCGSHDNYTSILKKYRKSNIDCICRNCSAKKENFHYLSDLSISDMARYYNGILFTSCICDEDTFNLLKTKPNSLEDFLAILEKDSNVYLHEFIKRMLEEPDDYSKDFPNLNHKVNNYDELYDYFYKNFMERWIKFGKYPPKRKDVNNG